MASEGQVLDGEQVSVGIDDLLISKTDQKGRLTYANRSFMHISGYPEHELLGQPHSIIRHPDIPRGVYRLMWEVLGEGREFFGFIKNRTRQGHYYWVFANVTPDRDSRGRLMGYHSVRRAPGVAAIRTVEPLYRRILDVEARASRNDAPGAGRERLLREVEEAGAGSYRQWMLAIYHDSLAGEVA